MERKIGEIFEFGGEWYQCVECDSCGKCSLHTTECGSGTKSDLAYEVFGECSKIRRLDNKHVIFKKLEKVGVPYMLEDKKFQKYKVFKTPYIYNKIDCSWQSFADPYYVSLEIKPTKEDMEENYKEEDTPLTRLVGRYVNNLIDYTTFEEAVKELYFDKEKYKPTLKPFDLEAAKQGKTVCTRDGRKARIVCFDKKCLDEQILIVLVDCGKEESIYFYTTDGKCIDDFSSFDLMMLPEKRSGWSKVRKDINLYDTKEEADRKMIGNDEYVTAKVCWEE